MSPLRDPPSHDRALGVEAVFAGQVDTETARSRDVVLWDDDAVLVRLERRTPTLHEEADAAA
jgi:hypothetical protein